MNFQKAEKKLLTIVKYTQAMLQNARQDLWNEVIETQIIRNQLMSDYFKEASILPQEVLSENISFILKADKEIIALGVNNRSEILSELNKINQGKKAVNAYMHGC